jgi:hypothetical protein
MAGYACGLYCKQVLLRPAEPAHAPLGLIETACHARLTAPTLRYVTGSQVSTTVLLTFSLVPRKESRRVSEKDGRKTVGEKNNEKMKIDGGKGKQKGRGAE